MRLSRRTLLASMGLGAAAVPACLSPTLPLPPPDAPDVKDLGNGTFRLTGALPIVAYVLVRNERTALIYGKGPLSEYELTVEAENSDAMTLWYETDTDLSSSVEFILDRLSQSVGDAGR